LLTSSSSHHSKLATASFKIETVLAIDDLTDPFCNRLRFAMASFFQLHLKEGRLGSFRNPQTAACRIKQFVSQKQGQCQAPASLPDRRTPSPAAKALIN
jgi:hypothetical protein